MKRMRLALGLFLFLLCSAVMGQTALPLPLNLTGLEPLKVETSGIGACKYISTNKIEFYKNSIDTKTGWCSAILQISDTPGRLKLFVECNGSACTDHKNYLDIYVSADNVSYTKIGTANQRGGNADIDVALDKNIRYIKFYYEVAKGKFIFVSGSYCAHGYDPTITITEPISFTAGSESTGAIGTKIAHKFKVDYSNPSGDLVLTSTNPHILFDADGATTKTISDIAGKEGSAEVTVYYDSSYDTEMGGQAADIVVSDAGNEGYSKTYTANITVDGPIALPEVAGTVSGIVGHAIMHTFQVNDAMPLEDLSATSSNENVQIVSITQDETDAEVKWVTLSYTPQTAAEGQAVDITLIDRATSFSKVYHLDYTVSDPFTLPVASMTAGTGVVGTAMPLAFTVNRLKGVALAFASENGNLVFEQSEMLPAEADGDQTVNAVYTAVVPGTDAAEIVIRDAAGLETYTKTFHVDFLSRPAVPVSSVEIKKNSIKVSWQPMAGVTAYLFSMTDADGAPYGEYTDYAVEGTSIEVGGLTEEASYYYTLKAKYSDDLISDASAPTIVVPTASCVINVGEYKNFEASLEAGQTQAIIITVPNAEGDVTATLSGSEHFQLLNSAITSGGSIQVKYAPVSGGIEEASLTLSTPNAKDVTAALKGYAYSFPATTLTEKTSFTLAWGDMGEVKSELSIDGGAAEDVTGLTTKTVTGLAMGSTHTYRMIYTFSDGKVMEGPTVSVTTTSDYGQQLNNSGFENWEGSGDSAEPVDWNSFMTNTGSLASLAKAKAVEVSSEVRPGTSGAASAYIWSRNVVGKMANGNLTCGRINAGDMSPEKEANHNFTVISDPAFSEAMYGAKPDSLTVWVKYVPKTSTDKARVSAILHDKYELKDPSSDADNNSHIVATAVMNYSAASDNGWQRLSIPFDYSGPAASADYMLVTYTTNMTPGKGSANDEVYIDDMLLVYNPKVAVTGVNKTAYKQGEEIKVTYNLEGTMSPTNLNADPNVVTLQLSDETGSFENAVDLTSVKTDYSGTLTAALPADLKVGDGYRVRIVTTNYPMVSEPNSNAIRVYLPGVPTVSSTMPEAFEITVNGNISQTIKVEGNELEGVISVALDKADEGFSVDVTELPAVGGDIVVNYTSDKVGKNSATITLTATGAEPVVITLDGLARPVTPVVGRATDITPEGFTANWEPVEGATGYELTITSASGDEPVRTVENTTSYKVEGLSSATEYTYTVAATVGEFISMPSESSESIVTLAKPVLSVDVESVEFEKTAFGESSKTKEILIDAQNLLGDITVAVSGADFEVAESNISKDAEEKKLSITFVPKEIKSASTGMVTISTDYVKDIVIALSGSSMPKGVENLSTTDITSESFVANWNAVVVEGKSVNYRITVRKDGETIAAYPKRTTKTSYTVSGLEANTTYTYFVESLVGGIYSEPSEEMEVKVGDPSDIASVSAAVTLYPVPARDVLYINGCEAKEVSIYSVDGMYIAKKSVIENRVDVSTLAAGSYLIAVASESGQIYKTRFIKE